MFTSPLQRTKRSCEAARARSVGFVNGRPVNLNKSKKEINFMKYQISMAPMEGLTGYVYRRAHHAYFAPLDTYYTPFISNKKLGSRERHDVLPEHNGGMHVIPQILTNRADDFLEIEKQLYEYGYREVNLNLGCPSGTVTAKGRGAGFLAYPEELSKFLDQIYSKTRMKISVKTRIGISSEEEWPQLLTLFNQFPIDHLIIHPRLLQDFYKGYPHMDAYQYAKEHSLSPIFYNGDIHFVDKWNEIKGGLGIQTKGVMLGRGLLMNPALAEEINHEMEEGVSEKRNVEKTLPSERLKKFHDAILDGYCEEMSGDRNVLFKMKELWVYLGNGIQASPKLLKQIKKSNSVREYKIASDAIFREYN